MAETNEEPKRRGHPGVVPGKRVRAGNVTLLEAHWRAAGRIGRGNQSDGIRLMIDAYLATHGKDGAK